MRYTHSMRRRTFLGATLAAVAAAVSAASLGLRAAAAQVLSAIKPHRRRWLLTPMTDDELIAKAIGWLRKIEPELPDHLRFVTVDQLPKRRIRTAVIIDFSSDEERDGIEVWMEPDTGDLIGVSHTPLKGRKTDDRLV